MSSVLSSSPGYRLLLGQSSFEKNRALTLACLHTLASPERINRLLEKKQVVIEPSFETLAESVRAENSVTVPFPCCAIDRARATLYIDASRVGDPLFSSDLTVWLGLAAWQSVPQWAPLCQNVLKDFAAFGSDPQGQLVSHLVSCYWAGCLPALRSDAVRVWLLLRAVLMCQKQIFPPASYKKLLRQHPFLQQLTAWAQSNLARCDELPHRAAPPLSPPAADRVRDHLTVSPKFLTLPSLSGWVGRSQAAKIRRAERETLLTVVQARKKDAADWAISADDFMSQDARASGNRLTQLELYPLAYMRGSCVLVDGPRSERLRFIESICEDMECVDQSSATWVPCLSGIPTTAVTVAGCHVDRRLTGACLDLVCSALSPEPVQAVCSTWFLQADRIRQNTPYRTELFFWAGTIAPHRQTDPAAVTPVSRTQVRAVCYSLPCLCQGWTELALIAGESYVLLECLAGPEFQTPIRVVAGAQLLPFKTKPGTPRKLLLTGFFLAGHFESEPTAQHRAVESVLSADDTGALAKNRRLRQLICDGNPEAAHCLSRRLRKRQSFKARRLATAYLLSASRQEYIPAVYEKACRELNRLTREPSRFERLLEQLTRAALLGHWRAMEMLVFEPHLQARLPVELSLHWCRTLAVRFNHAMAQEQLARHYDQRAQSTQLLREPLQATAFHCHLHALLGAEYESSYFIARAYALGLGTVKNDDNVRGVLLYAVSQQFTKAHYWLYGFNRMGVEFFTADRAAKLHRFRQDVSEGSPAAQLLLGLFYAYDQADQPDQADANLIALCLLRWVQDTIKDRNAGLMKKEIEKRLTPQQKHTLEHFDVWQALRLPAPPVKVPLLKVLTAVRKDTRTLNNPFLLALCPPDSSEQTRKRLRKQIEFISSNSVPCTLNGIRSDAPTSDASVALRSFGALQPDGQGPQLILTSTRNEDHERWNLTSICPYFPDGFTTQATLQSAMVQDLPLTAFLSLSTPSESGSVEFTAVDTLWPALSERYHTGDTFATFLYGLAFDLHLEYSIWQEHSAEVAEAIKQHLSAEELRHFENAVAISGPDQEFATYRINAPIVRVVENFSTLAGVRYGKIEVKSFLRSETDQPFVLYAPQSMIQRAGLNRGKRLSCLFELRCVLGECLDGLPVTLQ